MRYSYVGVAALAATILSGCVTTETVSFRASNPNQQAIIRDGRSALVSRQKSSLVMVGPASRQIAAGGRPVFVVGINNLSNAPVNFLISQVEASQLVGGQAYPMQVIPYETLVQEERNKQVAMAIIAGVAAGANAYGASRAGYGSYTTPSGRHGTFYSPTAAAIAQNRAADQNEAMISATIEQGRQNLAMLEQGVIKDNTLMPGEWYGGQLHLTPPVDSAGGAAKNYVLTLLVGNDRHVIDISQGPAR
ncbi:hypothetical protein [Afipia sp. P52-10]|jgi:hypothetical protein|uniref:hypothetical protein n=1 Tax=Afipia sp. P52-10 TaxID=1429916 RepID=UPI00126799F9|nr:hypothetical protein [Afipia sp. P52-10]